MPGISGNPRPYFKSIGSNKATAIIRIRLAGKRTRGSRASGWILVAAGFALTRAPEDFAGSDVVPALGIVYHLDEPTASLSSNT